MILLHQVGYVRQIELIKDEKPFTVKTLSVRPPIFGRYIAVSRKIPLHVYSCFEKGCRVNVERYYG